ncbi:hypothetical protein FNV43_RR16526 [Rhamnella rubrinervis]|uniref:Uncharacterized protein n=1 Tax=Rhamnella rubrinervis TaxID=2594499 RepID=A0A8K0MD33_9ROSA|nr:hypothetical protein FNV43_RR16526 [Rhamnella rubrinervis]
MADMQSYAIPVIVLLVSTILVRAICSGTRTKVRLPPSPLALPIIGHLHLLGSLPHQALHKLSNRYGPLIHLFLGSKLCVVASSAEIAKVFLKTNETSFSNRPQRAAVDCLAYGSLDFIFAPYGPYWKFMKRLCMSELLGSRTLDQLLPVRREELQRFLEFLLNKAGAGEEVDVGEQLLRLTNNVISRMCMSRKCCEDESEADRVRRLVKETTELIGQFNLSDCIGFCKNMDLQGFGKRIKEVRENFDTMVERIMEEHEEARKKDDKNGGDDDGVKDLLDILLDIAEDESSEIRLTRQNIKTFILDLFVAGTDTSAITIEWALAELINHPKILNKAREEIDSVIGRTRLVEESDIPKLPYLQAIVKETLRLHPAGPLITRESSENTKIYGYDIPEKTLLLVNAWAIGRDPNHWENPLEFKPERFVSDEGSGKNQLDVRGQHFHFLPFGSGRRGCPGTSLALQIVQTTLGAMIQCFEWKVGGGDHDSAVVDMEEGPGLTLPRAHSLICLPLARLSPLSTKSSKSIKS